MRQTVVALAALLLVLAGCGGKPAADPPPTHSAAPSVSSSPAPPVMPALAKQHTEAGAKAFLVYFFHTADYSLATLDTAPLEGLVGPGCEGCKGAVDAIQAIRNKGGRSAGGEVTVSGMAVTRLTATGIQPVQVDFMVSSAPELITYPDGDSVSHPGGTSRLRFVLSPRPRGWTVGYWGQAS